MTVSVRSIHPSDHYTNVPWVIDIEFICRGSLRPGSYFRGSSVVKAEKACIRLFKTIHCVFFFFFMNTWSSVLTYCCSMTLKKAKKVYIWIIFILVDTFEASPFRKLSIVALDCLLAVAFCFILSSCFLSFLFPIRASLLQPPFFIFLICT